MTGYDQVAIEDREGEAAAAWARPAASVAEGVRDRGTKADRGEATTDLLYRAAGEMLAMADETTYADLHALYIDNARLLRLAGEAIDQALVENSVLRTELAAANERAVLNAENARLWFDRVVALGAIDDRGALGVLHPGHIPLPPTEEAA